MNVVQRATNIFITPQKEWPVIEAEPTSVGTIMTGYVLPMLSIGAVATFIGSGLIGQRTFMGSTASVKAGLIGALLYVVLTVITVFIVAAAVDALSQSFSSEKNWIKSFKLAAYSLTPAYLAGLFFIFPALGILVIIVSVYSIYQLYTGIPILKKTPADKQVAYLAVTIIITIVAMILVGLVQAEIIKSINQPTMRMGGFGM